MGASTLIDLASAGFAYQGGSNGKGVRVAICALDVFLASADCQPEHRPSPCPASMPGQATWIFRPTPRCLN